MLQFADCIYEWTQKNLLPRSMKVRCSVKINVWADCLKDLNEWSLNVSKPLEMSRGEAPGVF